MNAADAELRAWQRDWRDQALPATSTDELVRLVHRGTRNTWYGLIAAVAFTLIAVLPLLNRAARGEIDLHFLSGILAFVVLIWATALWLGRGTWRPRDETTHAFLEVSIRRCRAALLSVPIAIFLYAAELAYILVSTQRLESAGWSELVTSRGFILAGWIGAPLYIGGQLWHAEVQRRRLARLQKLQSELAAAP